MATNPLNTFTTDDAKFMARALKLAEKGRHSTTPNPQVGCVIVSSQGEVIGEGFHKTAGQAHAEVYALKQAGDKAKGATVYVTLEPCSHTGRTPPCADALIKAGVKKVIISAIDPNPEVSGGGIERLKTANIEVISGLQAEASFKQNEKFFHRMSFNKPFITVKLASSLDGKTALANGKSKWITSKEARLDVQKHRATACAILTGADTVIADNPAMNIRTNELTKDLAEQVGARANPLLRVIIDGKNRLNQSAYQIFDQNIAPTIVYNLNVNNKISTALQSQVGAQPNSSNQFVCLETLFAALAKKEINHVWVEAGPTLAGALIGLGLVNRLVLYQAPLILGDKAKSLINLHEITELGQAKKARIVEQKRVGPDTKTVFNFD